MVGKQKRETIMEIASLLWVFSVAEERKWKKKEKVASEIIFKYFPKTT